MVANDNPDTGEAAVLIERLGRLMRAAEHESGLNPAQWECLRYLARCNRFSNSPTALTEYLAATKGTISQTLNALERKGLITKHKRPKERRSVVLALTQQGWDMLGQDPWWRLARHEARLAPDTRDGLRTGLRQFVLAELQHNKHKTFGICTSCHHFEAANRQESPTASHHCRLLKIVLNDNEAKQVCVHHESPPEP